MKKLTLLLLIVTAILLPVHAQNKFKLPEYEKFKLENGLTVYLMEQHEVPLINVSAIFPAGAVYDKDQNGLASLTADGLLFGTKNYTKSQIDQTVDFYGASISTYASQEAAEVSSSFLKDDMEKILPIIKDVIVNPTFNKEEFDKRKERYLVELDQQKESPRSVIRSYFDKFIYGNNPYGNPVDGNKSSVSKLTAENLQKFYSDNYAPASSAIAVVGDFSTSEMKNKIENLFGAWHNEGTEKKPISVDVDLNTNRVLLVDKDDSYETTFLIGGLGIKRSNPDYIDVQVVNTILGGRFTSWLNDELRVNSGLTYGARSSFIPNKNTGTFFISSFTKTATTTDAIDLALQVMDRLHKKGIDEATLSSAKNYMKGQFPPRYETSGSLANLLTSMYFYDFDESYINNFEKSVDEMTVDKASEIIKKYFPKENMQFVLIGKATALKDKVNKYGSVTEKEITAEGF